MGWKCRLLLSAIIYLCAVCSCVGARKKPGGLLGHFVGSSEGSRPQDEDHYFNVHNPFSGVRTAVEERLESVIKGAGNLTKIYEAHFKLLKEKKASGVRLLLKLKEEPIDEKSEDDNSVEDEGGLLSGLSEALEKAVNLTGSETAARHLRNVKMYVKKAKGGVKRMKRFLKKAKVKGLKADYHGAETGVDILTVEDGFSFEEIWSKLMQMDDVEFVEPDLEMELFASETDCPLVTDWGFQRSHAAEAIQLLATSATNDPKQSEVMVAVIDSGVDFHHPSLTERVWVNEAEMNGKPGVDDDGNGLVDDIYGWNFAENNGDVMDVNLHGTHVAGIIAAFPTEEPRFQGLAPNAKILPCKFTSHSTAGSISNAIRCMEYSWMMGADIMSNSWGGSGSFSLALRAAIDRAQRAGIMVVAAAGNEGVDNDPSASFATFPASFDHDIIVSVAAVDHKGRLASISNFGGDSVDIGAPGVEIWSTLPNEEFGAMTGTSMATPYVSGAAALLLGICRLQDRECSPLDIKEALISSAEQSGHLHGLVKAEGHLHLITAARHLGLVSEAISLQSQDEDDENLRDCSLNSSQRALGSLYIIVLLLVSVLQYWQ